jgi:regulator of protease activity HflC (stomatin/prohibitin superfamily)
MDQKESIWTSIRDGNFGEIPIVKGVLIILFVLFALFSGCKSCFSVDAGEVGVVFNTFTGTTRSLPQGTYGKIPWIEAVYDFDVRTQKQKILAESSSKDLQQVNVEVVVNYHLDYKAVNTLFTTVGRDYYNVVIHPTVNEAVKAATAKLAVENIIVEREALKKDIEVLLKERFSAYNIILESVNLTNISFSKEFNHVVEQKQIEEQKIKTAQYQKMQAEEYKQKTILEAEATARAQQLLSQTVTRDVIQLKWIEKWDGKQPQYVLGGAQPLINIPTNQ